MCWKIKLKYHTVSLGSSLPFLFIFYCYNSVWAIFTNPSWFVHFSACLKVFRLSFQALPNSFVPPNTSSVPAIAPKIEIKDEQNKYYFCMVSYPILRYVVCIWVSTMFCLSKKNYILLFLILSSKKNLQIHTSSVPAPKIKEEDGIKKYH